MLSDLPTNIQSAILKRQIAVRYFFRITAYNAGSPVSAAFHDGVGQVTYSTMDGITRGLSDITYKGSGNLIGCSDIVMGNDLSVRTVTVTLNQVSDLLDTYIRAYDLRNAPVQISRGLFDTNGVLNDFVYPRFVGFADTCQINTPSRNDSGSVVLGCVSCTRDLTVGSTEKRSHESQLARHAGDNFLKYTSTIGSRQIPWGQGINTTPAVGATQAAAAHDRNQAFLRGLGL